MVSIPGLYFVIAGDDRARFVRPDPKNSLHTIDVVDFTTLRKRDDDASAGPAFRTGSPGQHGLEQIRFVRLLAARIKGDFAADLFSHLVVVAPPHVLRDLMAVIEATIGASLFGSLGAGGVVGGGIRRFGAIGGGTQEKHSVVAVTDIG